jgi:hypothetical protein
LFDAMKKTYSEKLKDPRWLEFREEFIDRRSRSREGVRHCDDCGEDSGCRVLHVHHRLYVSSREPWEYQDEELRLLCEDCHDRLHKLEQRVRAFILAMPAHHEWEFRDFMDELELVKNPKAALAQAKNLLRGMDRK